MEIKTNVGCYINIIKNTNIKQIKIMYILIYIYVYTYQTTCSTHYSDSNREYTKNIAVPMRRCIKTNINANARPVSREKKFEKFKNVVGNYKKKTNVRLNVL